MNDLDATMGVADIKIFFLKLTTNINSKGSCVIIEKLW